MKDTVLATNLKYSVDPSKLNAWLVHDNPGRAKIPLRVTTHCDEISSLDHALGM